MLASHFAAPLCVFFVLFALNAFFWFDYASRKNKIAVVQKETRTLISATVDDQNISLEDITKQVAKLEKESAELNTEISSTTQALALVETNLLVHQTNIADITSSAERESEKTSALPYEPEPNTNQ